MKKPKITDDVDKYNRTKSSKIKPVTWIIFLFTFFVTVFSTISVVFPALIIKSTSFSPLDFPNSFELGVWAIPFLVINYFFLIFGILYYYKKIPEFIRNSIRFIFDFEISKKIAFIAIMTLLGIYIVLTLPEMESPQFSQDYEYRLEERVLTWEIEQETSPGYHVYFFLLNLSYTLFNNVKIIPFIFSIGLLILVYFISNEISKKRFAGIVSMAILLLSNMFLIYDTSPEHPNFGIFFYVLSLYLIFKFWPASSIVYLLSISSKPLTLLFFPLTLFLIYRSNFSRNRKIYTLLTYVVIIVIGLIFLLSLESEKTNQFFSIAEFNVTEFLRGLAIVGPYLRSDPIVSLFLLPLIAGLFLSSRKGSFQSDFIMVLISGIILSQALIVGITDNTSQPYRYVPLVVFFAIGVSAVLSKINRPNYS